MPRVAVVVPYFQREAGILRRSLETVFRQSATADVTVLLVDNDSPAPPGPEIAALEASEQARIRVIAQTIRGPGPARNAGLDHVPAGTDFVAFLDSDDLWDEHHLARAIAALSQGFDFYFADGNAEYSDSSLFRSVGFGDGDHPPVHGVDDAYEYAGDFLDQLLRHIPIVTSAVVMRAGALARLRFPNDPGTCEDLRYWLSVALARPRIAFSRTIGVTGGRAGVHMSHQPDWKTNKALSLAVDYARFYRFVLATLPLTPEQRTMVRGRLRHSRLIFLHTAAALLKSGVMPTPRVVVRFLADSLHLSPPR